MFNEIKQSENCNTLSQPNMQTHTHTHTQAKIILLTLKFNKYLELFRFYSIMFYYSKVIF